MLLCIVLASYLASSQAQLTQILQVAGETANKAAQTALTPRVNKSFKMPKQINSYADYLKYAGQAQGIIPITPDAEADSLSALAPGPATAESALAPDTAMAGQGQPTLNFQQGDGNMNPTFQDWQNAYKPVDKALNKVFETRVTNENARQVQWNLAVAAAPLQMLINDQVIKQQQETKGFLQNVFSMFSGKEGGASGSKKQSSLFSNPLTGTAVTPPTAEAPAPTAKSGSTVTVANPAAIGAPASAPITATTLMTPVTATTVTATAPSPASAAAGTAAGSSTTLQENAGEQPFTGSDESLKAAATSPPTNPLASLFSFPSFGKRKLLAN